mgnify:FL=1
MSWSNFIFAIAAVAVHELGHVLCAAALGIPIISFGAKSVGGVISFDFSKSDYVSEILVHLSGPLCGIAAAVLCAAFLQDKTYSFIGVSVLFALVNLLPITGFDGGGILYCVLCMFILPDTAWKICRATSLISSLLLWGTVVFIELRVLPNLGLLFFAIWVLMEEVKRK